MYIDSKKTIQWGKFSDREQVPVVMLLVIYEK